MKRRFSAIVMVAMLVSIILASCTKSELEPNNENWRITLSAAVGASDVEVNSTRSNSAQSKAPALAVDELELSFARADESSSGTYAPYAATPLTATRAAGAGEQSLTFSPMQYYLANGLKTKLTGWHPQGTYNGTTSTVGWTIDGGQDIMTAPKQEGSWTSAMPSMTFDHRLTQLRFHPYAETQSIINSWGKITKIEVLNQQNTVSYALADEATGVVNFSGAATNIFSAGIADAGVALSLSTVADKATNAVQMGKSVMIVPQSAASYVLTVRITTDKNRYTDVTLTGALTAGVPYRLYLRFSEIDITIETAVTQWDDVAAGADIGSGWPPVNPPTESVTIGGLRWAKGNLVALDETHCTVGSPTDNGVYFHFGSLVGWSGGATGDGLGTGSPALAVQVKPEGYTGSTSWTAGYYQDGTTDNKFYNLPSTDAPTTGIGDPCRFYLGAPWRTPTATDWLTLLGANGANTNKALPLKITGHELYFPASGYRQYQSAVHIPGRGTYWSSSTYDTKGYYVDFVTGGATPQVTNVRPYGFTVRCVSLLPTVINPPAASDYIEINGLKWTKGNLIAKDIDECKVGAPTDYGVYFHFGSLVGWTGGTLGDGTGTGIPPMQVRVKPNGYEGSLFWKAGYYTGSELGMGYVLPSTDDVFTGIGDPCRLYLGAPWRTPTAREWISLMGPASANVDRTNPFKIKGYELYFPTSGCRMYSDGTFSYVGHTGYYWSSSLADFGGYCATFSPSYVHGDSYDYSAMGFPVRCVSE